MITRDHTLLTPDDTLITPDDTCIRTALQMGEIVGARDGTATFENIRRAPLLWAASTWRIDRVGAKASTCHAGGWCVLETVFHVADERASAVHVAPKPAGGAGDARGGVLGGAFTNFEGAPIPRMQDPNSPNKSPSGVRRRGHRDMPPRVLFF